MGAFEMAYAGFQKLCGVLWASSSTLLRHKPKEWSQELLESFQLQDTDHRVTRRSAGVPYYLLVKHFSLVIIITVYSCLVKRHGVYYLSVKN